MTSHPTSSDLTLEDALRADRFHLRKLKQRIERLRREGKPTEKLESDFQQRLGDSANKYQARLAARPVLEYPDDLPITSYREEIVGLLKSRQVIVVCGETGSGKSTQLPKFCLEAGFGRAGLIGHTQPRRLAARSIAQRVAEEMKTQVGQAVGFKIRFTDSTAPDTLVKLMTDGILLAETQSDRFLDQYDVIIIDEAHERSLNIDFLLGYLRQLQGRRPDLRVVITSATIDAVRFAEHFSDEQGPAPILNVEGRSYPVEMRYLPFEEVVADSGVERAIQASDLRYDLARHVIAGIDEVMAAGPGDALVFLPTERDIRDVSHRVAGHLHRQGRANTVELLPLYARLPQNEQQRIFNPKGGQRRIVFATNVAESSLTVPRIHFVIDAGTARISRYSPRNKVQRLPIEPVSRASADQRAGRCGRIAPGLCVRLYSEEDYLSRDPYTTPEIRRTNLASVILQTKVLRLGPIDEFPFLDPPRPEHVREGNRTLHEIGALTDRHELTEIGWQLGRMPVDPRVGRMLLAAADNGVLAEVLPIAAAIEIQDPRERPPDKQQAADEAHQIFHDGSSDFLSYLRIWRFYHQQREALSRNRLQRACRTRFLSFNRMREWTDVHRQLRELAKTISGDGRATKQIGSPRLNEDAVEADQPLVDDNRYALIHQSLLTGLLSGVAKAGDKNEYTGAGGMTLYLWPGSGLFESKPKWIVAAELVETTRRYARTAGRVQPEWLEKLADHLVKRQYSEPHWSRKANGAFCYEQVTLFGLPIVVRRRVPLARIDPPTARDLLIEQGLVEGQLHTRARSVLHNRRLLETIAELAAKTRRRDLIVDPYLVERFYQQRLPEAVADAASLDRYDRDSPTPPWSKILTSVEGLAEWLEKPPSTTDAEQESVTLFMRPDDVLPELTTGIDADAFPDAMEIGSTRLPLEYHFEPGAERDGVTVTVPKAALSQISDERLGWLVPGMLQPKLVAMIKALPKRIRRNLVPAADVANDVCQEISPQFGQVPFMPLVCQALSRRAEMPIQPSDFAAEKLPEHTRPLVKVIDDEGKVLATGRAVSEVRDQLGEEKSVGDSTNESADFAFDANDELARDGITSFDMDSLPEQVVRQRGGVQVAQYPGLIDRGESVSLRVFADSASAAQATRGGLTRLFSICERKELRSQVRWLPGLERARLLLGSVLPADRFEDAMIDLIARHAFVDDRPLIRTRTAFEAARQERGRRIAEATQDVAKWLPAWAASYQQARGAWETLRGERSAYAIQDVDTQVAGLTRDGFLASTPWQWLQHYPRYFTAVAQRLDKLRSGGFERDREATAIVQRLQDQLEQRRQSASGSVTTEENGPQAEWEELRWMLEELRVSLFAQPLGTAVKVSPQRIEKRINSR